MKRVIILIIIGVAVTMICSSCSIINIFGDDKSGNTNLATRIATVESITVDSVVFPNIYFTCFVPGSVCEWFKKAEVELLPTDGPYDQYLIKLFMEFDKTVACIELLKMHDIQVPVTFQTADSTQFYFFQYDNNYLDTIIDIRGYLPD